jgi:hypothetical protein
MILEKEFFGLIHCELTFSATSGNEPFFTISGDMNEEFPD